MGKDRKDGKRVPVPALMQCCMDLKPGRANSDVYINQKMDLTNLVKYIEGKKEAGAKYTYFQAFVMAIGKVIYNRPKLNRFVANRHLYEHNDVTLSFVAKMDLNDKSEELMLIIDIQPEDTLDTLAEKLKVKIEKLRTQSMDKKGSNSAIDTLAKLPNFLRVPVMGIFKWADARGLLPASLTADNIYYSSMIISNLGSIHCGAIYHNLTNFGTCSSLAAMGEIKPEKVLQPDGSEQIRQICEFGITLDERIADGYYFSKSAKMIEYILNNPELLEECASTPVEIGEVR